MSYIGGLKKNVPRSKQSVFKSMSHNNKSSQKDKNILSPDQSTEPLEQVTEPQDQSTEPLEQVTESQDQSTEPLEQVTAPLEQEQVAESLEQVTESEQATTGSL